MYVRGDSLDLSTTQPLTRMMFQILESSVLPAYTKSGTYVLDKSHFQPNDFAG